jgi:hypothetical protein
MGVKAKLTEISGFEWQVDKLIYHLYNLICDKVKIIEPDFSLSENKYKGIQ